MCVTHVLTYPPEGLGLKTDWSPEPEPCVLSSVSGAPGHCVRRVSYFAGGERSMSGHMMNRGGMSG